MFKSPKEDCITQRWWETFDPGGRGGQMEILQGDRMQEEKKKEHVLFVTKIPSTP